MSGCMTPGSIMKKAVLMFLLCGWSGAGSGPEALAVLRGGQNSGSSSLLWWDWPRAAGWT